MAWIDAGYTDDYGDPVYYWENAGEIVQEAAPGDIWAGTVYGSGVAPSAPITDAQYQDYSTGPGISYVMKPGQETQIYMDTVPAVVTPNQVPAGFDFAKTISDAAGKLYKYIPKQTATGQQYYQRAPAGGLFGSLSPMMLAGIAAVAFLALSNSKPARKK